MSCESPLERCQHYHLGGNRRLEPLYLRLVHINDLNTIHWPLETRDVEPGRNDKKPILSGLSSGLYFSWRKVLEPLSREPGCFSWHNSQDSENYERKNYAPEYG